MKTNCLILGTDKGSLLEHVLSDILHFWNVIWISHNSSLCIGKFQSLLIQERVEVACVDIWKYIYMSSTSSNVYYFDHWQIILTIGRLFCPLVDYFDHWQDKIYSIKIIKIPPVTVSQLDCRPQRVRIKEI